MNEGKFSPPTVVVQNNKLYSHNRIIEICSALYLIGEDNKACVDFIKEVFADPFANTEESTIVNSYLCTTRTRQASQRCSNVRVVLFLYNEQQSTISEILYQCA